MTDYKTSLNLPKTKFSMKASLPQKEPQILKFWRDRKIYEKIRKASSSRRKYILHDGPPYANGRIHIGHALNKTLKDIVIKNKTMLGFNSDFIPGWDCHGLPVEHQLFKKLKKRKDEVPQLEFRKKAHDYAMGFVNIQREEFERLGIFGDWQNPYLTLNRAYEAAVITSFAELVEKGYIYQGLKPVNWCYRCETALAEAEVEYQERVSPSVYVKFKLKDGPMLEKRLNLSGDVYILIWTTTPWTLVANVAVAVNADFEYTVLETSQGKLLFAKSLLKRVVEEAHIGEYKIAAALSGKELEGLLYEHPFKLREGRIVLADYVSMEEGTGCVHTAPGHGREDYITGQRYKLETVMPVDEKGRFFEGIEPLIGMNIHEANPVIVDMLNNKKLLLCKGDLSHSYPHCWRCKSPIIFRATEQWFMSIDHANLRNILLDEIKKIEWVPEQGRERISTMVENRPDWCLSRQRYWGVPIPVFMCKKCRRWIADHALIKSFADKVKERGSGAWFELDPGDLIPAGYRCPHPGCAGGDFKKGEDILDVWFESGVSYQPVLKKRPTLSYPCDLYLEGSDQHRGWFQSALITSMATDKKCAFAKVLTHGFVVDGEGRKMSKSLGNVISPQDIIKAYGADILRLWVASSNYNDDIRISDKILARLTEAYRKIRNTARFILGNLCDFNPDKDRISYKELLEIDRWAISRAHTVLKEIRGFYDNFQFHRVYHTLYNFCIVEMSNFYLDVLKDRLYTFKHDSAERRSCQSALYEIIKVLVSAIAPITVFTAEEIWQAMPRVEDMPESIHLSIMEDEKSMKIDEALELKWQRLIELRDGVLKMLETERSSGIIRSSLEAKVKIYTQDHEFHAFLKENEFTLPELFIVSQVEIDREESRGEAIKPGDVSGASFLISKADGVKCARCWNYSVSVGDDKDYPHVCARCSAVVRAMKGETQNE